MLRNYLIVSLRNQLRNKVYFLINLFGLTLGIVNCLYGFLWIKDELSVNSFHKDLAKIAMVKANWQQNNGDIATFSETQGTVYQAIKDEIPEAGLVTRVSNWGNSILMKAGDKSFIEQGIFADPEFWEIFSFPMKYGNADALDQQNTIAISETLANKYFGETEATGKTFEFNGRSATVTAVFYDVPVNSTLQFNFILPFEDFVKDYGYQADWTNYDFFTFVKLNNPDDFEVVNSKLEPMVQNHLPDAEVNEWLFLQPFKDTYLYSKFRRGKVAGGRIEYVRIFGAAILFILFIGCINFVNLATSRAANRSKEVGLRKVNGAHKSQLVFQFLAESFMITLISMVVSLIIVDLFLPAFNLLTEKSITFNFMDSGLLTGLAAILVFTSLAAGLYPAFYLSKFKPAAIMKGASASEVGGSALRKFLVAFQFALSVILLISTFVISKQINFIRETDLGFDRENIVVIRSRPGIWRNFDAFRNKALANPEILNLGTSNQVLLDVSNSTTSVDWQGKIHDNEVNFRAIIVGMDFLETMGIKPLEGRLFSNDFPYSQDDSLKQFIVTKESVKRMNLDNPIGEQISLWDNPGTIVGVVDDFHSKSIHTSVDPIVFMLDDRNQGRVFIKLQKGEEQAGVQIIEKLYKELEQDYPFEYSFMDEAFNRQYKLEALTGKLANLFSAMAIAISCLGLFGLTSFIIERRTREIGIRKVLGASVSGLIFNLSSDFVRLFIIAVVIGCPVAYFLMKSYLDKFAYHTTFDFRIVGITTGLLFLISVLTIIYHITKAALSNPAEVLRNE